LLPNELAPESTSEAAPVTRRTKPARPAAVKPLARQQGNSIANNDAARSAQPIEPILVPKVRIHFADFP